MSDNNVIFEQRRPRHMVVKHEKEKEMREVSWKCKVRKGKRGKGEVYVAIADLNVPGK